VLPELKISAFVSGPLAAILHFHQIQIKNMTFWCFYRWVCEDHPDKRGSMMAVELPESFVRIHSATKMRIRFF
jgi:hypothetical protein